MHVVILSDQCEDLRRKLTALIVFKWKLLCRDWASINGNGVKKCNDTRTRSIFVIAIFFSTDRKDQPQKMCFFFLSFIFVLIFRYCLLFFFNLPPEEKTILFFSIFFLFASQYWEHFENKIKIVARHPWLFFLGSQQNEKKYLKL